MKSSNSFKQDKKESHMTQRLERHVIAGLGSIGKMHARILMSAGCSVCGVDPYAPGSFDFDVYDSIDNALAFNPDMIWLCTPTELHWKTACEIIEKRIHLFIEKPVAHTMEHAQKILKAHERNSQKSMVWVGSNMRFHPAVTRLKQFLDQNLIGNPLVFRFHFSHWLPNMRPGTDYRQTYAVKKEGGGIILDNIHDIDLALWFSGPVKKVAGCRFNSGLLEMEAEDMANISLCHENNIITTFQMDYLRKDKSRGIEIIGEKGSLEWRSYGKNPEQAQIRYFPEPGKAAKTLYEKDIHTFDNMFEKQYQAILKRIEEPQLYARGLNEAVDALNVALEAKKYQGNH